MIVKELMTGDVSPVAMFVDAMVMFSYFVGHSSKRGSIFIFYLYSNC